MIGGTGEQKMNKLILALSFAAMLFGAAQTTLGGVRCITGGWPVTCTAVETVGEAQDVTLGATSVSTSAVVCFIDSRVIQALSSAGIGLDSTKIGAILFIR